MSATPLVAVRTLSRAEKYEAELLACYIAHSGLRGRFEHVTLDDFQARTAAQREVVAALRDFVQAVLDPKRTVRVPHLIGTPGTGKTMLAAAVVHDLVHRQRRNAVITTARQMIRRLRATWAEDADETELYVLECIERIDLLVVDEVDIGFGSEAEQTQLFDVIDRRYVLRRPTMVISNLNEPRLQQAIGERSFDRLREGAVFLRCTWPSYRASA